MPAPFDGAFSNFAALNCVTDLTPVGRGLAALVRPGGKVLLVIFGVCPPGEWVVQLLRGDLRAASGGYHAVPSRREWADATFRCAITAGATWFARWRPRFA